MKRTFGWLLAVMLMMMALNCFAGAESELLSAVNNPEILGADEERAAGENDAEIQAADAEPAMRVSYLGPRGTYTEQAAKAFFGEDADLIPESTVGDAIQAVVDGASDYAVIPQENSLGGPVVAYVDALIAEKDVYVIGEITLPISQTLLGIPGAKTEGITRVYSHTQGLAQSAEWLNNNLPGAERIELGSTAEAARYVSEQNDPTMAAIASEGTAALYGLEVLERNVQISMTNRTRFYVLAAEPNPTNPEAEYTNALLIVRGGAGQIEALLEAVGSEYDLAFIHDRPEGSGLGEYCFLIELIREEDGNENENGNSGLPEAVLEDPNIRYAGSFDVLEVE